MTSTGARSLRDMKLGIGKRCPAISVYDFTCLHAVPQPSLKYYSTRQCPNSMTSFILKEQENRPHVWDQTEECVFCKIIEKQKDSCVVYEDEKIIAFLGKL